MLDIFRCFHEVISRFLRNLANRAYMNREIEKFKLQAEKCSLFESACGSKVEYRVDYHLLFFIATHLANVSIVPGL